MRYGRIHRCKGAAGFFIVAVALCVFLASEAVPFGKNKVNKDTFQWNILKTIHFDVYYPSGMEDLAVRSAQYAEEGYAHLADYLRHELTQTIPVIIYPSHIAFQENNILLEIIGEGTGGFTEAFKNRVVVPFTGSYADFHHVLVHELTHAFQYNMLFDDQSGARMSSLSFGGMPLWMMEGMSEYLSIGYDETADMVMRDIIYNEKYATLMDLTRMHVRSPYLFYKEGQAFYYFLEKQYGKQKIGELFRDVRDVGDIDEAFKTATGKNLEDLNQDWIRFYKKRYYPVVKGKVFDEEEGEQLTFHLKTESSFNVCPAVSPDGKRIAFITNMDIYSAISIVTIEKKEERKVKTVLMGDTSAKFEGMHLLSNNLSWSRDGKVLVFVAQSGGRDVIFLIDPEEGGIRDEIALPFRAVMDPSLSRDGTLIAFSAQDNLSTDIYIFDLKSRALTRVTRDAFTDRYPVISPDNRHVLFSSTRGDGRDAAADNFDIHRVDMASGDRTVLVKSAGSDLQADIAPDGKSIVFISNRSGIYNAYRYKLDSGEEAKVTDVLCGIFYPRWYPDGTRLAFVGYQNLGYDIFVKEFDEKKLKPATDERDTEYIRHDFPSPYFPMGQAIFDDYTTRISPDYLFFGIGGTIGYGFAGFARMGISDYLGDHRIELTTDYLNYSGSQSDINFDAAYYYLKYRWDFGVGMFRQRNPYGIFTLSSVNDLIHNVYASTLYVNHYGAYAVASYPFSKFFRFGLRATSSRYEHDYSLDSERRDVFANLNQLAVSLNYDNVLWGYMVPLDGFRGQIEVEQAFNLTGQDFQFTSYSIDLRKYFFIYKRYTFALRGSAGKITGKDSEFFKFFLGGFNTLRGHPFLEYSGNNYFLCSTEFRFIFIEGIKMGWPLFFRIGGIGGVLFSDFGSAWDGRYRFIDSETGNFGDFKSDVGFGFRLTLFPLIIIKLDYAWAYYYKSFGNRHIIFSLGFEY
ncbi:MAG: hypothetical protein EPN93_01095 [Spirochaetes bacterium]|nr:MAG: hypothetical protein EPN93_01095 [Spirochaetota bacterium]